MTLYRAVRSALLLVSCGLFALCANTSFAVASDHVASGRHFAALSQLVRTHLEIYRDKKPNLEQAQMSSMCELILQAAPSKPEPLVELSESPGLYFTESMLKDLSIDPHKPLTMKDLIVATRNAPKNKMGDEIVSRNEIFDSARYTKFLQREFQYGLLLLPSVGKRSVPGFDGVIYDSVMQPVANYSLKSAFTRSVEEALNRGIAKANRFASLDEWMPWADHTPFLPSIFDRRLSDRKSGRLDREKAAHTYNEAANWLAEILRYLGIDGSKPGSKTDRPYLVVLKINDPESVHTQGPDFFDKIQTLIKANKELDSVSLILDKGILVITEDEFDYISE